MSEQSGGTLEVEIAPKFSPPTPIRQTIRFDRPNAWQTCRLNAPSLHRITFRTGAYRGIGGANPVDPASDRPHEAIVFRIRNVRASS